MKNRLHHILFLLALLSCGAQASWAQPTFTGPTDITIQCDQNNQPSHTGTIANVMDTCVVAVDTSFSDAIQAGSCINTYQILRSWTVHDACGNQSAPFVQTIFVIDTTPPVFEQAAGNGTFTCGADDDAQAAFQAWLNLNGTAIAKDNCSPQNTLRWFAAVPGSYDLSDPFSWPGTSVGALDPPMCPSPDSTIYQQEAVDFVVYDECNNANSSTATFKVVDEIPPVFSNCPADRTVSTDAATCTATFTLPMANFTDACGDNAALSFAYQINNNPPITADLFTGITVLLDKGAQHIQYLAIDCAGNIGRCTFIVDVIDEEAPQILCPADTVYYLSLADNCSEGKLIQLPQAKSITDNCTLERFRQSQPSDAASTYLTFSYDQLYEEYIADDKQLTFVGTAADAVGNSVQLSIRVEGDVEESEAYFTILDEDTNVLGTTAAGQPNVSIVPGDCNSMPAVAAQSLFTITIDVTTYNRWAADGNVNFLLISNKTFSLPPPGNSDEGINPFCNSFAIGTPDGSIDSISNLIAELSYERLVPQYSAAGATTIGLSPMLPPTIQATEFLQVGSTMITYQISDLAGNTQSCSFEVEIFDTIAPQANCVPTTIFVNPSGLVDYILTANEVDGGSTDNCAVAGRTLSSSIFSCSQAGNTEQVILTTTDDTGNTANCTADVRVELESAEPDYSIGICGNDDLNLFANAPFIPSGFSYSYFWTGPKGFSSIEENPIISNANFTNSGTYILELTGLTGCKVISSVDVIINPVPDQPEVEVNDNMLCRNDTLFLNTQQYNGLNVRYDWYSGIAPGGSFLESTSVPQLMIASPLVSNAYYVIVEVDGCSSNASASKVINVTNAPSASVREAVLTICEGESFSLGTDVDGAGFTYQWTGPNGFSSSLQNPDTIRNAVLADSGNYVLVISANGCPSQPATTVVNVRQSPQQPILFSDGLICEGASSMLTTNVSDADFYSWYSPKPDTQFTSVPQLVLMNVDQSATGEWQVVATKDGCESVPSVPLSIFVEPLPLVEAENDGPACEGGTVQLMANSIPGANYTWSGPGGFSGAEREVSAPAVMGIYELTITNSVGCSNTSFTQVLVNEAPEITAISTTAPPCVDGNSPVSLVATLFPADNGSYTYAWTGPNNFSTDERFANLPTGTAADNGSYTLVVTDENNCSSLPQSISVGLKDKPIRPTITGPIIACSGADLELCTDSLTGIDVRYHWLTPTGTITTAQPCLSINMVSTANGGTYRLITEKDGCNSDISPSLELSVTDMLPPPMIFTNSPVCTFDTLQLSTDLVAGATYQWTGPNNFQSAVANPIIPNVNTSNAGIYELQIAVNSCTAPPAIPVEVTINAAPGRPALKDAGAVCISEPGATTILSILPGTETPGASYTWYDAQSDQLIGGPSLSTSLLLNNFSNYQQGSFGFYVIANKNGCASMPSEPTILQMDTIPTIEAMAGIDGEVCDDALIQLDATAPMSGTGLWTIFSGPAANVVNVSDPTSQIIGMQPGNTYGFQWVLSNGACINYDRDSVFLTLYSAMAMANAGTDIEVCNDTQAQLNASPATGDDLGRWSQSSAQAANGSVIESPSDPNSRVSGLLPGFTYTYTWIVSNPGCGDFSDDKVEVEAEQNDSEAFAGGDFTACGNGSVMLMAEEPDIGTGSWSSDDISLIFEDPSNPETIVNGLETGTYTLIWTIDKGICGLAADTILLHYELGPQANDDAAQFAFASRGEIDVLANDIVEGNDLVVLLTQAPQFGTAEYLGNGIFLFKPLVSYAGPDQFRYQICSQTCPDECSEAIVDIMIGDESDCEPPTIFTPNNDGVNDSFIIPCMTPDRYPNSVVSIFNQWGGELFRASPYRNDWTGIYDGEPLPAGTYYYVVDFGNGDKPKAGFLVLER